MDVPLTASISHQTTGTMATATDVENTNEPHGLAWALGRLARGKETEVWSKLIEQVGPDIQRLARRLIGDRSLAEDAEQETYLLIRDHATRFSVRSSNGDDDARHWILNVAANASLQLARRHSRQIRRDRKAGRAEEQVKSPISDPSKQVDSAEDGRLLRSELAELPVVYGQALSLHYFAGLDYPSLAVHLRVSVNTVRSRVNRGLKALRERLNRRGVALSLAALTGTLTNLSAAPVAVTTTVSATKLGLITSAAVPTTSFLAASGGMLMASVLTVVLSTTLAVMYSLGWFQSVIPKSLPAVIVKEEIVAEKVVKPVHIRAVAPISQVTDQMQAAAYFEALFGGDIDKANALSATPFSLDRKKILTKKDDVDAAHKEIVRNKGKHIVPLFTIAQVDEAPKLDAAVFPNYVAFRVTIDTGNGKTESIHIYVSVGESPKILGFSD